MTDDRKIVVLVGDYSSLLRTLCDAQYLVRCADEPKPFVDLFLSDPKRWAFTLHFKMLVVLHRLSKFLRDCNELVFCDFSPHDVRVYVAMHRAMGCITDIEYALFLSFFDLLDFPPHYSVYIPSENRVCKHYSDKFKYDYVARDRRFAFEHVVSACAKLFRGRGRFDGPRLENEIFI